MPEDKQVPKTISEAIAEKISEMDSDDIWWLIFIIFWGTAVVLYALASIVSSVVH